MNVSISTHQATSIRFNAYPHVAPGDGGYLTINVGTDGSESDLVAPFSVIIHTWDLALWDHFRDLERVTAGPIGSLHAKPPEVTEAPA